jgi:hypothetical protein
MGKIDISQVNPNDLPIDKIPEDIQYIKATVVEVYIGLHKHVRKKINDRPILTRFLYIFVPLVQRDGTNLLQPLYDPIQLAQEQINRCWIPVEED